MPPPPVHASFINLVSHHARGSNFLASERVARSSVLWPRYADTEQSAAASVRSLVSASLCEGTGGGRAVQLIVQVSRFGGVSGVSCCVEETRLVESVAESNLVLSIWTPELQGGLRVFTKL